MKPPVRYSYNCRNCGAIGQCYPSEARVYCSESCRSKYTQHPDRNPHKGKKLSSEHRLKLSIAHIGIQSGSNHPLWKGGTSSERKLAMKRYEYRSWRTAVFARDEYTCQHCRATGVYLHAHHGLSWRGFPDLRYDIDNGITLCETCHAKADPMFARLRKTVEV